MTFSYNLEDGQIQKTSSLKPFWILASPLKWFHLAGMQDLSLNPFLNKINFTTKDFSPFVRLVYIFSIAEKKKNQVRIFKD